jgi:hypothetical protein
VKKTVFLIFIYLTCTLSNFAQISIENRYLDLLRSTALVVVHPEGDEKEINLFKEQLGKVWKVNELIFMTERQYTEKPPVGNYSFLTLGAQVNTGFDNQINEMSITNTHPFIEIWMDVDGDHYQFVRIEMHVSANYTGNTKSTISHKMNGSSLVYNYSLGYVKNVLGHVSNYIGANNGRDLYYEFSLPQIVEVKKDTLLVPDFLFVKYNSFGGTVNKTLNIEKIMSNYPYPYKIVSNAELSKRILDKNDSFFYVMYIRSSTFKYVSIWNSRSNRMFYSKFSNPSYNFEGKDMKKITSKVKKN